MAIYLIKTFLILLITVNGIEHCVYAIAIANANANAT